jgi:hypothetical protein
MGKPMGEPAFPGKFFMCGGNGAGGAVEKILAWPGRGSHHGSSTDIRSATQHPFWGRKRREKKQKNNSLWAFGFVRAGGLLWFPD